MKKIISIILCLAMLFAMFALPVAAAEEVVVTCVLHIGDTTQEISGAVGDVIKFPMPFKAAADMGKHFVTWCTDEACEKPLMEDPTFTAGETVHYYAWLKDFATYYKEDFNSVKNADTVIQYAHDQSGAENYYGYTMPLYNTAISSGTGVAINKATDWYEQHIFFKDTDGTYVTVAPNTTYHMEIKYRVTEVGESGGKIDIYPIYGINSQYVGRTDMINQHSVSKTGASIATLTAVTDDWVTQEVDFTTGDVLMEKDGEIFDKWVPNIGFRLFNSSGSTTTEIDYIEVEKYKTVNFKFLYDLDRTATLLKDDVIEYPALEGDSKWSLSKNEYIPVPETMGLEDITIYEYSENVDTDSCAVTYVKADGTESKARFTEGKEITYPVLNPADYNKADLVWSLSDEEYVAPPKTMGTEDITVYEYANPAMSFENYNHSYSGAVTNNWLDNAMISDEMALSGNYSMRYRNYNLRVLASEPASWATDYTNYYRYDEDADEFVQVADETAPDFVEGEFYETRESYQRNQGTFFTPIYLGPTADGPYTYNYKLSVKYYVPEGNETGVKITAYHINTNGIYFEDTATVSDTYTIPATATDGWKTLEMDISAKDLVVNANGEHKWGGQAIVLKVDTASATGANAANVTVYFDDISYQDAALNSVLGDCDGDGEVDIDDLAALKLHLAGMGKVEFGADCDKSGEVDIDDLALLKLYLVGKTELVKTYRILAIGNSYTVNGTDYLGYIARDGGEENFVIARATMSGAAIENHYYNIRDDAAQYTYQYNDDGDWWSGENKDNAKLSEVINAHDWNVIVIHGCPLYCGNIAKYWALQDVLDWIKEKCPNATIIWQMTWADQADSQHAGFAPYNYDQETMYQALLAALKSEVLTKPEIEAIIPTGTAVQNFRKIHGDTISLDGYHLGLDYGLYLAALCWYRTITGNSIEDIDWVPPQYTYVADELDDIKWCVEAAMKNPYEVTYRTTE